MFDILKHIKIVPEYAQFIQLDSRWKTANFFDQHSVVPYNRLYMVMKGSGTVSFNNHKLQLTPGKIYLIPAYAATEVNCDELLVKYWAYFNVFWEESKLDLFFLNPPPFELTVPDMNYAETIFKRLTVLCRKPLSLPGNQPPFFEKKESEHLLMLLLLSFLKNSNDFNNRENHKKIRLFKLIQYIEENLDKKLDLKVLSAKANLNSTYLTNIFKDVFGISLIKYYNNLRINRAVNLLCNSDYSIEEIAWKVGFENPSIFARLFKRRFHLSPRFYRLAQAERPK